MAGSVPTISLNSGASTERMVGVVAVATGVLAKVAMAMRVHRERRHLLALDDATLKDLGLTRVDAEREAGRSLFDLPNRRA